jgi:hypothetical protein
MSGYPGEGEYSDDDTMNSHFYDHEAHRESLEPPVPVTAEEVIHALKAAQILCDFQSQKDFFQGIIDRLANQDGVAVARVGKGPVGSFVHLTDVGRTLPQGKYSLYAIPPAAADALNRSDASMYADCCDTPNYCSSMRCCTANMGRTPAKL